MDHWNVEKSRQRYSEIPGHWFLFPIQDEDVALVVQEQEVQMFVNIPLVGKIFFNENSWRMVILAPNIKWDELTF